MRAAKKNLGISVRYTHLGKFTVGNSDLRKKMQVGAVKNSTLN